jgi:ribosomal protein S18 acetylase RimI-like enzyme
MITKIFKDKIIIIRNISSKDFKNAKKFQDYINSLVEEEAKILFCKKVSLKFEQDWLKRTLDHIKKKTCVYLVAEHNGMIVGLTSICLEIGRRDHIGGFGISVKDGYRGIGLGKYLLKEIVKLAKKELKPKIIDLEVYINNKPAINLYKKCGFKEVARIPKAIQYKGKLISEIKMFLYL